VSIKYHISGTEDGRQTVSAYTSRGVLVADQEHVSYAQIVGALLAGASDSDRLYRLFRPAEGVIEALNGLNSPVRYENGQVLYDGVEVNNDLTRQIARLIAAGDESAFSLVSFLERVELNPSPSSRLHLFHWLKDRDFTITPSGHFLAYKYVQEDFGSCHSGSAIVDGVPVEGHIPNKPGSVVEMERGEVDPNRQATCSYGLHVATWYYAASYGSTIVLVLVDPADVVSVPNDYEDQKMRVCKYQVLKQVTEPVKDPLVAVSALLALEDERVEELDPWADLAGLVEDDEDAPYSTSDDEGDPWAEAVEEEEVEDAYSDDEDEEDYWSDPDSYYEDDEDEEYFEDDEIEAAPIASQRKIWYWDSTDRKWLHITLYESGLENPARPTGSIFPTDSPYS
jgi:hypothetical protein